MALLWTDGFDNYGASSTVINDSMSLRGYTFSGSSTSLDDDAGRLSGNSLEINYTYGPVSGPELDTTNATIGCGFGWKFEQVYSSKNSPIFRFYYGSDHVSLELNTLGKVELRTGSTILATTNTVSANTWYFIEWKFTVGSNAAYLVKFNGTEVLSGNGNTQDGSATYYNGFSLFPTSIYLGSSYSQWFDDLYIFDASGSDNTDLLGDCRIVTIYPDGDGTCNFATLSTGTDHYALVDDKPCDGDTTYVEDTATGNRDLLTYGSITSVNTILAVNIITTARRTDTNSYSIRTVVDSGSTVETGETISLGTDYSAWQEISIENPDTSSAWTPATINAADFGYEIV